MGRSKRDHDEPLRSPLIFAYNADSGFLEALKDGKRKVVSPSTHPCRLCALTYGLATMRPRWRRFVEGLGVKVEFLHRDEFRESYGEAGFPWHTSTEWENLRYSSAATR